MRLIDANVFEKFIKEKYKDGESTDDVKDQMLFDLSYQPTAYDVEKVVEELSREFKPILTEKKGFLGISQLVVVGYEINTSKAIEIVRRGGVE